MVRVSLKVAAIGIAALGMSSGANAATMHLDGFTSTVQTVTISSSPLAGTTGRVGASGFNFTDTSGSMGSFVAWCLDIAHWLVPVGGSQDYAKTTNPYSNSQSLTSIGLGRVQSVFDANFGGLDASDGDQAAAFQMALWEAAFEGDTNSMSVSDGYFQAYSWGSTTLANTYLANAASYTGDKNWNLKFLEVTGLDASRGTRTGQNLVTVSAVPLPAGIVLLASGMFGFGAMRRRK
ncbi:MAG: VPLPA-CTERM sorting domain-containing protein [Paracoccaceae bacterium]